MARSRASGARGGQLRGPGASGGGGAAHGPLGRLAHHWIPVSDGVSTGDLVGDGLTLFVGPAGDRWANAVDTGPIPLTVRVLDNDTAAALGQRERV